MPIRYETPGPLSTDISYGYGQAQAMAQANPLLMRAYENIASTTQANRENAAQRSFQGGQAAADRSLRGRIADADRVAEMNNANANRIQDAGQFASSIEQADADRNLRRVAIQQEGMATQRDQFVAVAQQHAQEQRFQQQVYLQDQELSQGERIRFQKLQQGKVAIQEAVQSGSLLPEEGEAMMLEMQTGIDVYKQRMAKVKAAEQQQMIQMEQEQAARMATIQNTNESWRAKGFPGRVLAFPDPVTGQPRSGWLDDKGNFNKFDEGKGKEDDGVSDLKAEQEIVKLAGEYADRNFPQNKDEPDKNKLENARAFNEKRDQLWAEYQRRKAGRAGGPGAGSETGPPPPPQEGPPPAPRPDAPKPFKLDDAKSQSPAQRLIVQAAEQEEAALKTRTDIPAELKEMGLHAVRRMRELVAKTGSVAGMSKEERAEYNALKAAYSGIPQLGSQAPRGATATEFKAAQPHLQGMIRNQDPTGSVLGQLGVR
jgi:hypothetical protein